MGSDSAGRCNLNPGPGLIHLQATSIGGQSFVIAAQSKDTEEGTDIIVWRKRLGRRASIESESHHKYFNFVIQMLMIVATMGFIVQNG